MNVGENIRRIRKELDITQEEVSKRVGITQSMLCQIERGSKNPSLQTGKLISDVLGCSLEELLK